MEFVQEKAGLNPPGVTTQKSRSIWATSAEDSSKPQKPTQNRTIVVQGPNKVGLKDMGYPQMKYPKGPLVTHGVVLKVIATNICGSDLHMSVSHPACRQQPDIRSSNSAVDVACAAVLCVLPVGTAATSAASPLRWRWAMR